MATNLSLGQRLYLPLNTLVVPVTVIEVNDVYSDNGVFADAGEHCSVWLSTNAKCRYARQGSKETDKNGWSIFVERDPDEVVAKCTHASQFVWIDEPLGHAASLGDDVFLTLNEALQYVRPSKKKHLRRRLKAWRNSSHKFILYTWRKAKHPGFDKLFDKKVYVRRG